MTLHNLNIYLTSKKVHPFNITSLIYNMITSMVSYIMFSYINWKFKSNVHWNLDRILIMLHPKLMV